MCSNRSLVQFSQTYCNYGLKDSQGIETKQRIKKQWQVLHYFHLHLRKGTFHSWYWMPERSITPFHKQRISAELPELLSELRERASLSRGYHKGWMYKIYPYLSINCKEVEKQNNVAALQMAHLEISALTATSVASATQQSPTYRFFSCSQTTQGHCCGYSRNALCELMWSFLTSKFHPPFSPDMMMCLLFVLLLSHIPLRVGGWASSPWIAFKQLFNSFSPWKALNFFNFNNLLLSQAYRDI